MYFLQHHYFKSVDKEREGSPEDGKNISGTIPNWVGFSGRKRKT